MNSDRGKLSDIAYLNALDNTIEFSEGNPKRQLYTEMNEEKSKSNLCKEKCIDEGKTFCPNTAWSGGKCCEIGEQCPRDIYCSSDNPKSPRFFKYLMCPNELACEGKQIYPTYDGVVLKRAVDEYTNKFLLGDVCGYIAYSPWEMTPYDKMHVKIYGIKYADVYIAKGKNIRWFDHLDQIARENQVFDTRAGW